MHTNVPTDPIPLPANHVPRYLTKNKETDHDGLHLPLVGTRQRCVSAVTQALCEFTTCIRLDLATQNSDAQGASWSYLCRRRDVVIFDICKISPSQHGQQTYAIPHCYHPVSSTNHSVTRNRVSRSRGREQYYSLEISEINLSIISQQSISESISALISEVNTRLILRSIERSISLRSISGSDRD